MAPRSEFKECLTSAWNSIFIPLVQELWPSLTFTLSHISAMKPRDLELFSCFTTSALHLEPPGRRAAPPRCCRERVPTGTPTPRHAHLAEQLSLSLAAAGQVGGGRDEVLGVHRSCGKTGTGEFSCFPLSPRTEFMMFCEWFWWSSKADCGEFPQFLTGAWNSIFSLKSKIEMWICDKYWQVISLFVQVKHVVA